MKAVILAAGDGLRCKTLTLAGELKCGPGPFFKRYSCNCYCCKRKIHDKTKIIDSVFES